MIGESGEDPHQERKKPSASHEPVGW